MVDRSKTSSTTGTSFQRAGIACQSCRLRKVKASHPSLHCSDSLQTLTASLLCSAMRSQSRLIKRVVHVDERGRNVCWTLYQTEEGLLSMDKCTIAEANLITMRRSVNREYVDKLQQRIKNLEQLNQSNQSNQSNQNGTAHPVDASVIPDNLRYVGCE